MDGNQLVRVDRLRVERLATGERQKALRQRRSTMGALHSGLCEATQA
jgi:hypothetical protein